MNPIDTIERPPGPPTPFGLATWLRHALAGEDLAPFGQSLLQRAEDDPGDSAALLDAAIVLQCLGHPDLGLKLQHEALERQRHYRIPATRPVRLRLLALMAPGKIMVNVPVECLLEDSDIELHLYYARLDPPDPDEIPDHDVLFVAIDPLTANRPLLDAWIPRLLAWPRPVLNDPRRLERIARDSAYRYLHDRPGLLMPPTLRLARARLAAIAQGEPLPDGLEFPLLLRPLDSHAGQDLYWIDTPAVLEARLACLHDADFFLSRFIDYRGADGLFRKYRLFLIGGRPFACHMAISSHWMIHYLNAGMAESADKRAEEARFMAGFEQEFAVRHRAALTAIHQAIGLDHLGIDCAESRDGRLLVFEIGPAMVAHAMDPVALYPYKPDTMQRLFAAFRALLIAAARRPPGLG